MELRQLRPRVTAFEASRWWRFHPRFAFGRLRSRLNGGRNGTGPLKGAVGPQTLRPLVPKPTPWPPEAVAARRAYGDRLGELIAQGVVCAPPIGLRVVSFSSEADLPEQAASLRSFLTHVGTPSEFTIVSDGSHSKESRDLLHAVHPCVAVVDWRAFVQPGLPEVLFHYADKSWRGRKLLMLVTHPVDRPLLFADADILFFPAARELRRLPGEAKAGPRYLLDCERHLDRVMLRDEREGDESINSGFMFFSQPLDWTLALRRLEQRVGLKAGTYTEQTVVHLTLHEAGARSFDPSRHVVAWDDWALLEDAYVGPETVLRHYVTPVRHKFWTKLSGSSDFTH